MIGVGRSSVISQAVPTLPSQMPILEARLASHTARKVGIASGVQAEGLDEGLGGRIASAAVSSIHTPHRSLPRPPEISRSDPACPPPSGYGDFVVPTATTRNGDWDVKLRPHAIGQSGVRKP